MDTLTSKEMVAMLTAAIEKIRQNHDELSKLDGATGDGDHGTTMLRAVDAIEKAAAEFGELPLKEMLHKIGWGIMCCDGGSTGPLLGSLFMGMSAGVGEAESLDKACVAEMFDAGLAKMAKQSKAQVGDKTMMDALIPAVEAMKAADTSCISEAVKAAADAAKEGAANTANMQAKFGRARNLGERTLGHIDPGATSISYIFQAFSEALSA